MSSGALVYATFVSSDSNGNIYLSGTFWNGNITFGIFTLTNSGGYKPFLVKVDPSGNVIWAKTASGASSGYALSTTCDFNNEVLISGYFMSPTITFGTFTLTNTSLANAFVVKYDASGNVLWAKNSTCLGIAIPASVSSDASGNVYVTGSYSGTPVAFGTYTLPSLGYKDIFLVKYSPSGNELWARRAISTGTNGSQCVSADANGDVYIAGDYSSPIVFGTYTLSGTGGNLFLAKYDSNGNAFWAKNSISSNTRAWSLCAHPDGAFVTGSMDTLIPIILGTYTLNPPVGRKDPAFLARYDANGNVLYATALASGGDDWFAVAIDKSCNAFITGDFYVNNFVVGNTTLALTCGEQIFTAKLSFTSSNCSEGIQEFNSLNSILNISPNPNAGSFKIQIDNEIKNSELILINSLGQKVYQQKITQGANEIKTYGLPIGLYNCLLFGDKQAISNSKIIIE